MSHPLVPLWGPERLSGLWRLLGHMVHSPESTDCTPATPSSPRCRVHCSDPLGDASAHTGPGTGTAPGLLTEERISPLTLHSGTCHSPEDFLGFLLKRPAGTEAVEAELAGQLRSLHHAKFPSRPGPREALLVLGQWALEKGHGSCSVPTKDKEPSVGSGLGLQALTSCSCLLAAECKHTYSTCRIITPSSSGWHLEELSGAAFDMCHWLS
ncbi:uncharacterized protein LOC104863534 [Fukomys damarensis]|uniref:uncharacterized protein LOC104863534 n=1 Tax=Fukomys damarensis TaxID=885580 RepID=UPI00053F87D2|nr:uncharacterized protein LOC104863534 [Fukomys damarensis]